jgi:hypothetical protein
MALIAQILLIKLAGSNSSRLTFHDSGIYYERVSSELKELTRKILTAINGRVNLLCFSERTAIPPGRIGVQPHTSLATTAPTNLARTRQTAQQHFEIAYAYGPRMLAHDRRVLDIL